MSFELVLVKFDPTDCYVMSQSQIYLDVLLARSSQLMAHSFFKKKGVSKVS